MNMVISYSLKYSFPLQELEEFHRALWSNHSGVAWIISDHQIKPKIWGSLVPEWSWLKLPGEVSVKTIWASNWTSRLGGNCMYHTVSAKMTSVLATLGNLPLTSIILFEVSVLICERVWKGITTKYFSIWTICCAAVFVAGYVTEERMKARIEWQRCLDEKSDVNSCRFYYICVTFCVHSVCILAVFALTLCGSCNIFSCVGSW